LSQDSSSSEEDEKIKCKKGDFTGLCLMGKSSLNDSDSDVMDGDLKNKWLMNSGCSRHMTGNKKWFSSLTPLSHKEDEKIKCKKDNFTGLCLMGKSSPNDSDSDSDVMDGDLENKWLMNSGCSRHMTGNKK
jgi:sarcosine oxidase delta subunit